MSTVTPSYSRSTARWTASRLSQTRARAWADGAAADGAGAGEMVVDLAAHHRGLAADGVGEVGRSRGRGVGDHRQRRLQRMGEVAGVAPRLLGLGLAMREQLVDLLGQRPDFGREIRR